MKLKQRKHISAVAMLREELERRGMSRAELELASGLSRTTIDEILRGARNITPNSAMRLDRALGWTDERWIEKEVGR